MKATKKELIEALNCAYLNCTNLTPEAKKLIEGTLKKAKK